ncbi:MAG: hypothetical protein LUE64_03370 [Candidatus Gastranaerophilales bacterium]|nr:hypothetical protein [Candidatus Gastranaerophilales bacterium]
MGFAASQARFLSLTARLSDNEYEAQQISQERVALNNQMALYADEYETATSNKVMIATVFNDNGTTESNVTLSYSVITGDYLNGGLGMNLVTSSGLIVVSSEEEMNAQIEASDGELTIADFYVYEDVTDTSVLQRNLEEGNFYIAASKNEETGDWDTKSIDSLNNVTTTYDTTDDAAAKATYDKRITAAEAKDASLELRLDQLETSHNAIETEMDSVQNVIDKNIESSFETFG